MRWMLVFLVACAVARAEPAGRPRDDSVLAEPPVRFKIDLAGAHDSVLLARTHDGSMVFLVTSLGSGNDRMLTPMEFAEFYYAQRSGRFWWNWLFNVTSPAGIAWVALGLGGQILFAARMLVQWIASEKHRASVVPEVFWWMSLGGATMLLAYFLWRRDIVGILGQATGWAIYIRNIVLIQQTRKARAPREQQK